MVELQYIFIHLNGICAIWKKMKQKWQLLNSLCIKVSTTCVSIIWSSCHINCQIHTFMLALRHKIPSKMSLNQRQLTFEHTHTRIYINTKYPVIQCFLKSERIKKLKTKVREEEEKQQTKCVQCEWIRIRMSERRRYMYTNKRRL